MSAVVFKLISAASSTFPLEDAYAIPFSSTQRYCHPPSTSDPSVLVTVPLITDAPPQTTFLLSADKLRVISASFTITDAGAASSVSSTTGASAANASASVATEASVPSLNSAAQTGTLEVASIATTRDILKVFLAMPFFVFLIFVMIIVPLWVVDRLFLWKFSYPE